MKVLKTAPTNNKPCSVALGTFDGLHIGHIQLVMQAVEFAKEKNIDSCIFTFMTNPTNSLYITSNEQRQNILASYDVDVVIMHEFSEDFKSLSPEAFFYEYIIDKLNAKIITVGFNYHFGHKGNGDIGLLSELCVNNNIELKVVEPVLFKDSIVSSTRIRDCIENGDLDNTNLMLNRPFSIIGNVQSGDMLGRELGFRTANVAVDLNHVMPPHGVYVTITELNGKSYQSITNYGGKPTIRQGVNIIETHILDFDDDIYGVTIEVNFVKKLRDISKFTSIDELKNQLNIDKANARKIFNI